MEGSIMGQVRHGSATTTHAVRAAIQRSQASLARLCREFGINPETVAKWRRRAAVADMMTGPRELLSTVLTEGEEAAVVALRTHLADFLAAYNFARRLKTLGGLTPYEHICKIRSSEPDRFILDPIQQMPGLNT